MGASEMMRAHSEVRYSFCYGLVGLAAMAAVTVSGNPANARHHLGGIAHSAHVDSYSPPTSWIVVDGNTGAVLRTSNPDGSRHPASLTKIMTLYLLFERLEERTIKLDTQLRVSEHAAKQAPTKLGLSPGQTIAVEDAIKAVVTKSANDAAVTIAENLGGDEVKFAKLMTEKAHALGMSHTNYVNASGLPDDDQNTTARDQALLGRAIQERFPHFYKYFSTKAFVYRGMAMRNHNHLLGVVGGVDGIKTGYTRASGFNLVTSVHRDGRYIVAVILGRHSASERDAQMRELINAHMKEASLRHSAPVIVERAERPGDTKPAALANAPHTDATPMADMKMNGNATVGSNDPIQPLLVKTITYRTVKTKALGPMPAVIPVPTVPQRPASVAAEASPRGGD
jgi:D-alanyl-D-alanine carboxypeptidase